MAAIEQVDSTDIPEAPRGKRHIPCPVPGFPGYVAVSAVMTPDDFQRWYAKDRKRSERKNDSRHPNFQLYECGNHLLEWHVDALEPDHFNASDGSSLPAMELVTFGVYAMLDLVEKATKRPI